MQIALVGFLTKPDLRSSGMFSPERVLKGVIVTGNEKLTLVKYLENSFRRNYFNFIFSRSFK